MSQKFENQREFKARNWLSFVSYEIIIRLIKFPVDGNKLPLSWITQNLSGRNKRKEMSSQRELKKSHESNFSINWEQIVAGKKRCKIHAISLAKINSRDIFFSLFILPLKYVAMATIKNLDGLITEWDTGNATSSWADHLSHFQ